MWAEARYLSKTPMMWQRQSVQSVQSWTPVYHLLVYYRIDWLDSTVQSVLHHVPCEHGPLSCCRKISRRLRCADAQNFRPPVIRNHTYHNDEGLITSVEEGTNVSLITHPVRYKHSHLKLSVRPSVRSSVFNADALRPYKFGYSDSNYVNN